MDKLKAWLALTEYTPTRLAAEIGAHQNSVHNWISGRAHPGGIMIRRLHVRTGIPLEDLVPVESQRLAMKPRRRLTA